MKPLLFLMCLIIVSCKQQKSDLDQASNVAGGRCLLSKNTNAYLCITYNNGYDSNTALNNCTTEYNRYAVSGGVNGQSWLSGNANSCALATSATSVGNCTRSDGVIYYYNSDWSAGSAQTDCTSTHAGTWNP